VIYKYKLCRKNGVWQTKVYNAHLSGASLEGKVIGRDGEKVKLHLSIDDKQSEDEAAWFAFSPPTGNIMYCMPEVGTSARLYFPNEISEAPIVTGCLRTNGGECKKTSDTTKRYLGTKNGSEIEMIPDAINIKGGSNSPLSIKFEDGVGITLTSPKKLTMSAEEEIIMRTPKSVKINAQSQLAIVKTNSGSGLAVEGDLNYKSNNVIIEGTYKESFPDFHDDPKVGKKPKPPKEEKKPFNLLGVGLAILGATAAIVVAVALAPELILAIAVTAAVGAVVSGGVDVLIQVEEHGGIRSKKAWSNVKWDEVIISACGGAASGALAVAPLTTLGEVAGWIGGPGYIKSYHESEYLLFSNAFYAKEALMGARKGIAGGAGTTVVGEIYNKVKGMFSGDEKKRK
jgi:hypothetical protein